MGQYIAKDALIKVKYFLNKQNDYIFINLFKNKKEHK